MELIYFVLGIIFVSYLMPILDSASAWLLTWFEAKKATQSEKVNRANIKMRQEAVSADASPMHTIGFQLPDDDYYSEEDEE